MSGGPATYSSVCSRVQHGTKAAHALLSGGSKHRRTAQPECCLCRTLGQGMMMRLG